MRKPPKVKLKNNNYRLISIDIDDTILPNNTLAVSKRFRRVVAELEKKDVRVCINTGRNAAYALPVARGAGIKSLCAALEGLSVFEPSTGEIIYENPIGSERLQKIIHIAESAGVFIETTDNGKYYRFLNKSAKYSYNAGQVTHGYAEYVKNAEELFAKSSGALCVTLGGDKPALAEAVSCINEECKQLLFRNYLWENYSVISSAVCDVHGKTYGLSRLCDYYGIEFSQVVAIGDYINDAGMIGRAGLGVSMGNGHKLIKSLAGYVTDNVGDDGAAKVLEKIFKIKYKEKS